MLNFTALPAPLIADDPKAVVKVVDEKSSAPCRRCLKDGDLGEEMLLTPYDPFLGVSPYSGPGPIFVHRNGCESYQCDGSVPDQQRRRLLSIRAYDANHMMVEFTFADGDFEEKAEELFKNTNVEYLHAYYAGPGCFAVRVDKASA